MIGALIDWSLRNRFLVLCGALLLAGLGVRAIYHTPVDAIPDLSENQVIVFADWPGRSPQEVEDQVTYPLSVNLQGLAKVRDVRALSMFGFSLITVIFDDGVDNYFARARVLERLNYLSEALPAGVTPKLGPDATGLGWIYQYYLRVDPAKGQYDLGKLRSVQDWFVRYQLGAVPGVAEVASIGGFVRQFSIEVSSLKMKTFGVTLQDVLEATSKSNLNVGGKVIEENGMEFVLRGVGLVHTPKDLETIVLKQQDGVPVYLSSVAEVIMDGDFRRGALDVNGQEVVGGVVVMRTGENAYEVIRAVKEKIASIAGSLPPGVEIVPFYDRSELIERTIETLKHALTEEIILVTLAHILFLFHFRSILIVTLPLPASILIAFILMKEAGMTSNVMSLSGIAIAIGVLVDAAIVLTENVLRHAEQAEHKKGGRLTAAETMEVTREASLQVGRPIFFAMAIIILAFVPVFALTGQEGKLFHPLAFTKTFAMVGATLLAVTLVPVLCTLLVRGPFHAEDRNVVMRALLKLYDPTLRWALKHRLTVLGCAVVLLVGAGTVASRFGREFMPPLNEGSLLLMPVLLPSTSLTEVKRIMAWQDRVISMVPEVVSVAGKLGRAETSTDPAPVEMIETTIMLRPEKDWRPGLTKDGLIAELTEKLSVVPGYVPGFLQPIENRILMISTGIRAQVGIKIFGDDLDVLQAKAFEVERLVKTIPGAVGVAPSRVQGKPYVEVVMKREAAARFGLSTEDVMRVVQVGLGGEKATTLIEGRERIPVQVRLQRSERDDIERLGEVLVSTENGGAVPLGTVADIRRVQGASEIWSENGRLRVFVQANVQGRDLGSFVDEIKRRVAAEIQLEPGTTIGYSGQFEHQIRAARTLILIVPMVLGIIFILLYLVYRSFKEAAHVLLAVPFAMTGGVFAQWWMGYPFSVAVWVGYIALFGTAIQTGVVMVVYLEEQLEKKKRERGADFSRLDLIEAVVDGARLRLRPKVMTVATIVASLVPIMWSTRPGAEIMKPLATPVLGGMISSLLHILIVTPVIFIWLREREQRRKPIG